MTRRRAWRGTGLLGVAVAAALGLAACSPASGKSGVHAAAGATTTTSHRTTTSHPTASSPSTTSGRAGQSAPPSSGGKAGSPPASKPKRKPDPPNLRLGDHGAAVLALQRRLAALGYEVRKPDGELGSETSHAVVAFQKVNRLERDGVAGPKTMKALAGPRRPSPRQHGSGLHIEADLTLQVVYVVSDGRIEQILDASSGSGQQYVVDGDVRIAHTPEGSFRVERKINGWHRSVLGLLYRPAFFVGGYALHGAPNVPPFPASHGCIRITTTAMDGLYDRLAFGTPVLVYRS